MKRHALKPTALSPASYAELLRRAGRGAELVGLQMDLFDKGHGAGEDFPALACRLEAVHRLRRKYGDDIPPAEPVSEAEKGRRRLNYLTGGKTQQRRRQAGRRKR